MVTHCCIIPLTLPGSWRPLRLMNERRMWSLHCPHVQIYIPEGGGQRERESSPHTHSRPRTLPDSIFSQRGAHFSCGTDHEREGGRPRDKTRQRAVQWQRRAKGNTPPTTGSFAGFCRRCLHSCVKALVHTFILQQKILVHLGRGGLMNLRAICRHCRPVWSLGRERGKRMPQRNNN